MYQTDVFRILSLNAWNAWWLLQEAAGGVFLADDTAVLGPLGPRHLGYLPRRCCRWWWSPRSSERLERRSSSWG